MEAWWRRRFHTKRSVAARNSGTNQVISLWKDGHNVGVLSSTDAKFLEEMKEWARKKGYEVKEGI